MRRLTDKDMKRLAEDGGAGAMMLLWQELCLTRNSEALLLDVLEEALPYLERVNWGDRQRNIFTAARDAIAKAEGRCNCSFAKELRVSHARSCPEFEK